MLYHHHFDVRKIYQKPSGRRKDGTHERERDLRHTDSFFLWWKFHWVILGTVWSHRDHSEWLVSQRSCKMDQICITEISMELYRDDTHHRETGRGIKSGSSLKTNKMKKNQGEYCLSHPSSSSSFIWPRQWNRQWARKRPTANKKTTTLTALWTYHTGREFQRRAERDSTQGLRNSSTQLNMQSTASVRCAGLTWDELLTHRHLILARLWIKSRQE